MSVSKLCFLLLLHLSLLVGCGGDRTGDPADGNTSAKGNGQQAEKATSAEPAGAVEKEPAADAALDLVPADALLALVTYPRRVFSEDDVAQPWERFLTKVDAVNETMATSLGWLESLGIRLADLEQVVYVAQNDRVPPPPVVVEGEDSAEVAADTNWEAMTFGVFQDAFVFRFHGAAPWEGMVAHLFHPQEVEYAGKTYFGAGKDVPTAACYRVDENTVLIGEETVVRKMLIASEGEHPLVEQIKKSGPEQDLIAVLNLAGASEALLEGLSSEPQLAPVAKNLTSAALALDMGPRPAISATIVGNTAEGAAQIDAMLRGLLEQAKQNLPPPEALADPALPKEAATVFNLAHSTVKNLKIDLREDRVEISLGDVVDRSDLTGLLDLIVVFRDEGDRQKPRKPVEDENETATIIRRLATSAAGMANADMARLAMSATTPKATDLQNQSLTMAVLCDKILSLPDEGYEDRLVEFRFASEDMMSPFQLVRRLNPSTWLGYCSMLQPQYITKVTCDTDGKSATGAISFDAGIYAGRVQYKASKTEDGWQIDEFSFPARDWRFVRVEDGTWQWFDHFGRFEAGRALPKEAVEGVVQLDGKPLDVKKLSFTLKGFPDFTFYAEMGEEGKFSVSLPPGEYRVVVQSDDPQVDDKYGRLSTTPLTVDIAKDQTEMTLKIPAAEQVPKPESP